MHEEEDSARLNHNRTRRDIRSAITELGKGINPDSGPTKKQHHQLRGRSRIIGCRLDYSIPNNNNKKIEGGISVTTSGRMEYVISCFGLRCVNVATYTKRIDAGEKSHIDWM